MNDKLNELLDGTKVKKILERHLNEALDLNEILDIKIIPIKTYLDETSFSFIGIYELTAQDTNKKMVVKKVFASAHSTPNKRKDFIIGNFLADKSSKYDPKFLKIPESYAFIESHGLYLREYIDGETLDKFILKNHNMSAFVTEIISNSLLEFQKIKISSDFTYEDRANFTDLNKNITILEKQAHSSFPAVRNEFKEIEGLFHSIKKQEERSPKVLSHGDFNLFNLVITSDNEIIFIDYDDVGFRNYLWDVARLTCSLKSDDFLDAFFKAKNGHINESDQRLFDIYKKYFGLLDRTHVLVWGF